MYETWPAIIRPLTGTDVCPIAVRQRNYYCVYLYINCCHSSQGVFPAVTKYFNQTCPGDKPEKQGVVRNQLILSRWCAGSETTKKSNPHDPPSSNLLFRRKLRNRTWSLWTFAESERRTSRTRRISPHQSLARSETPPLLVAELAWSRWDRDMRTTNMTVTTLANPPSSQAVTKGEKGQIHPVKRDVKTGINLEERCTTCGRMWSSIMKFAAVHLLFKI